MSSPLPQKKLSKDDLRRLMKERRENLKIQKVDSPFAKYNNLGQLSCIICNIQIKSNALWVAHVAGKIHKENAVKKKKGGLDSSKDANSNFKGLKRLEEQQPEVTKKQKTENIRPVEESQQVKNTKQLALLEAYSSSSEDEEGGKEAEGNKLIENVSEGVLPPDFFENGPTSSDVTTAASVDPALELKSSSSKSVNDDLLPEGFFDDPVLDAKARNIEYKDPKELEWEKFQKTIAEETNVSKTIIEGDLEESTLERDIVQIDEQIQQWKRIKNLETLAEEVKMKALVKEGDGDMSGSTDEDLEEDDLLDWRSKSIKKI